MTIPHLHNEAACAEIALGQLEAGAQRLERAIPPIENKDVYVAGWAFSILADAQRLLEDPESAERSALRGMEIGEFSGHPLVVRANGLVLGRLAAARGEWSIAEQHALAMLDSCAERGYALWMLEPLEALAEVAAGLGSNADAVRLLAATARARSDLGLARWKGDGHYWARLTGELRARLGDEFASAWASGDALTLTEAIAWARRARGERKRPAIGWESLTPTEERIVELATEGLTNPQIGERMFISRATVKTHLEHVYAKLGVNGRTELAAAATARQREASPASG
jgi:DNA-binding CsgD family transcriptional regulator